jgi:hypothetical protein
MVAELPKIDQSLYETDDNLWVLETASQLGVLNCPSVLFQNIPLQLSNKC